MTKDVRMKIRIARLLMFILLLVISVYKILIDSANEIDYILAVGILGILTIEIFFNKAKVGKQLYWISYVNPI